MSTRFPTMPLPDEYSMRQTSPLDSKAAPISKHGFPQKRMLRDGEEVKHHKQLDAELRKSIASPESRVLNLAPCYQSKLSSLPFPVVKKEQLYAQPHFAAFDGRRKQSTTRNETMFSPSWKLSPSCTHLKFQSSYRGSQDPLTDLTTGKEEYSAALIQSNSRVANATNPTEKDTLNNTTLLTHAQANVMCLLSALNVSGQSGMDHTNCLKKLNVYQSMIGLTMRIRELRRNCDLEERRIHVLKAWKNVAERHRCQVVRLLRDQVNNSSFNRTQRRVTFELQIREALALLNCIDGRTNEISNDGQSNLAARKNSKKRPLSITCQYSVVSGRAEKIAILMEKLLTKTASTCKSTMGGGDRFSQHKTSNDKTDAVAQVEEPRLVGCTTMGEKNYKVKRVMETRKTVGAALSREMSHVCQKANIEPLEERRARASSLGRNCVKVSCEPTSLPKSRQCSDEMEGSERRQNSICSGSVESFEFEFDLDESSNSTCSTAVTLEADESDGEEAFDGMCPKGMMPRELCFSFDDDGDSLSSIDSADSIGEETVAVLSDENSQTHSLNTNTVQRIWKRNADKYRGPEIVLSHGDNGLKPLSRAA